ncbi:MULTISPECIES: REP-associated tyrosine transposase [unclassified Saccharicrinis]|uniref:REP-associated tyrosine transposase n=1 Tax=unclassified Saccharicrinis TaxID=2646859 RepID=UPI003D355526
MSDKYKIFDNQSAYFITMTTVGWIDVFTRKNHKMAIVDSLKYCQKHKGLEIYGWCLMPSHLHAIVSAAEGFVLSDILRDFKKYTSKKIVQQIKDEPESRREWLLPLLKQYCIDLKRDQKYKLWQDGNHAEIIYSNKFFDQKLNYIHQNPVEDMMVAYPEDYLFSSARNYAELPYLLEVILESQQMVTYA